jgi:hypothetical protein
VIRPDGLTLVVATVLLGLVVAGAATVIGAGRRDALRPRQTAA